MDHAEVLLIGGRAGVGKTTVGWEVSALLRAAAVPHSIIEGDFMGQVHPAPEGDPHRAKITESNLAAVWANFAERGYHRLIYTNTLSVLPETAPMFQRALGAGARITRVLLTASDATARDRLSSRELGSELEQELRNGVRKARLLDEQVSAETVRVATDGRPVPDIALEVATATGWLSPGKHPRNAIAGAPRQSRPPKTPWQNTPQPDGTLHNPTEHATDQRRC